MAVEVSSALISDTPLGGVITTLKKIGIVLPENGSGRTTPAPWLVRGEEQNSHLVGDPYFSPHPGKWETFGVFFGDNPRVLFPGTYYVFSTDVIATEWLIDGSCDMKEQIAQIANSRTPRLNLNTIGGYFEAASAIYRQNPVYRPYDGIATTPHPVAVSWASFILVNPGVLDSNLNKIPRQLRDKIVPLDIS